MPAFVISAGLVFCETKEWNDRGVVKRAHNQHQNEPNPSNQPTKEKKLNNQTNNRTAVQLANINQLLKQNKSTNALGINILLVCHFYIKQSVKKPNTINQN